MSKKDMIPTPTSIRKAYVEEYLKRRPDAEEFARFTESELADFIRKHESPNFESIYTQLDYNYYDRVRHDMAIDGQMRMNSYRQSSLQKVFAHLNFFLSHTPRLHSLIQTGW